MKRTVGLLVALLACVALAIGGLAGVAYGAVGGVPFDGSGSVRLAPDAMTGGERWALGQGRRTGALGAQAEVSLPVIESVEWVDDGVTRVDGLVENPAGALSNVEQIEVRLIWHASDDSVVGDPVFGWVQCWVLPADTLSVFTVWDVQPPAGAVYYSLEAIGFETTEQRVPLTVTYEGSGYGPDGPAGARWWVWSITNDTTGTVVGVLANGWEHEGVMGVGLSLLDVMTVEGVMGDWPLEPGESLQILLEGGNIPQPGNGIWAMVQAEGFIEPEVPEPPPLGPAPVLRFYDLQQQNHFYTCDGPTIQWLVDVMGYRFAYEGVAFWVHQDETLPDMVAVHRFEDLITLGQFYTIDPSEQFTVESTMGSRFVYSGDPWRVPAASSADTCVVYRFLNMRTGDHFYTADPAERDSVVANLGYVYFYEGPAFNALLPRGRAL